MNDELIASAELGEQARNFLDGELGKVLVGLAEQEKILAQEALAMVDPEKPDDIRKLQNRVQVSVWFTQWLNQLVTDGEQAIQVFKQQRDE